MFSRRVPGDHAPNELTRLLQRKRLAGASILDLTETNPTRVGLSALGPAELQPLADPRGGLYEPDPLGMAEAREAVARYYAGRGLEQPPGDIVLLASTSEAYAHLFRLLCDPGDEIVAPRPSYPLFEPLAALEGVRVESYDLRYDGRWGLDRDSLDAALSPRTRAVLVVQPNNPTGSCLSPAEAAHVESLCADRGIALISDEVFGDFPWPPAPGGPLPSLLGERRALTFVLGGISKLCGLPQMKLGWIAVAGPDRERLPALRGLEWIADLVLSVSTPAQLALPRFLDARHGFHERVRERLGRNLARLRGLGNERAGFGVLCGEGGWSAVLATSAASGDPALAALMERDVLVHPGHFYDMDDSLMVVSLLPEPAIFGEAVERLASMG
jgi:aspartate/methionine/tyrosine aminotransferase